MRKHEVCTHGVSRGREECAGVRGGRNTAEKDPIVRHGGGVEEIVASMGWVGWPGNWFVAG